MTSTHPHLTPTPPTNMSNNAFASIDIDTGINIVTVTAEVFKGKKVFTAFSNNISIRSSSLSLARLQENFIDCIECAAGGNDPDFTLEIETVQSIGKFITDNLD